MKLLLITALLVAAFAGWYWLHRRMKGDEGPMFRWGKPKDRLDAAAEMEAFIAAYRAGKITPAELKSGPTASPAAQAPPANENPPAVPAALAAAPSAVLRPELKLAYLLFRAALPDHHLFPLLRLSDLGHAQFSDRIDLLICNAEFKPVVAVDIGAANAAAHGGKTASLQAAGIRYVVLSAAQLPRPAQARALVYPGS